MIAVRFSDSDVVLVGLARSVMSSSRVVQIDPARLRARHFWFVAYSDVLLRRLGSPVEAFRDGLRHSVPDTTGLPVERLYQNLLASYLTAELLAGPLRFDEVQERLQRVGWLQQDLTPLVDLFGELVLREEIGSKEHFSRATINLLLWRMSVRVAAGISLPRLYEELANMWGMEEPDLFIEEAISSAALPVPPTWPNDDVQARVDFLTTDTGFQRIMNSRLAEYDEHAWTHPDLPHVIRPWVVASLVGAMNDAGIPGFSDEGVLARCIQVRRDVAQWVARCTAVEGLLLMPRSDDAT
jgi:hypothetical protein